MLYPYVSQFNWIDILIIVCAMRMCYIGLKKGFGIELFKFINLIFCSYIALHYYTSLGEFINSKIPALPKEPAKIFSYIVIIIAITMLFRILREAVFVFVKQEAIGNLSKYTGLLIGFLRGILISALIIFGLIISTVHYFELSAKTSFFGAKIVSFPVKIYEGAFSLTPRIFKQGFNQEVIDALEKKD